MISQFEVYYDVEGNLHVADGYVYQPSSGVLVKSGSGDAMSAQRSTRSPQEFVRAHGATGSTMVGGSGRNAIVSGMPPLPPGSPVSPNGVYTPLLGNLVYRHFSISSTSPTSGYFTDGLAVVANWASGSPAPLGVYASTPYGEMLYGGPFSLTISGDGGDSGWTPVWASGVPSANLTPSPGSTVPDGGLITADNETWALDGDIHITLAPDGTADLFFASTVIASRDAGAPHSPAGTYYSTPAGETMYDGAPWFAEVAMISRSTIEGYVYLAVSTTSGVLSSVEGPFFGTLPENSISTYYFPIAFSDGAGQIDQIHSGMIIFPGGAAAGESTTGLEWVSLTEAAFDALTTKDPDTIYDVV